jgi:hypothetical protein
MPPREGWGPTGELILFFGEFFYYNVCMCINDGIYIVICMWFYDDIDEFHVCVCVCVQMLGP